jgi:hypothetical protein
LIPPALAGPRPHGGVGGTRNGVKCLHAHVAWWLAGGDDPVGRWVSDQVEIPTFDLVGAVTPSAVAAIDCGTNSTRLLVADENGRS